MKQDLVASLLSEYFLQAAETWRRIAAELKTCFSSLDDDCFLQHKPATKFILSWMRDLKGFQDNFGELFRRQKRPSVADDFTAAVALCLAQFIDARGSAGIVRSEKKTKDEQGAPRPDISIWTSYGVLVATVECKADLGWTRKNWKEKCVKRTRELQTWVRGCDSYLCVMWHKDWSRSEYSESWYCLSKVPAAKLSGPVTDSDILMPVEPMFLDILARLRAAHRNAIIRGIGDLWPEDKEKLLSVLNRPPQPLEPP